MIRLLIALDIDGTVVRQDGLTVSPRVCAAVKSAHTAGHHVVLSTGRSPSATMPVANQVGLNSGFAVCSNGAATLRLGGAGTGEHIIVSNVLFEPQQLLGILAAIEWNWPESAIAVELPDARGFRASATFPGGQLPDLLTVERDQLGVYGASRLIVCNVGSPLQLAKLAEDFGFDCVDDARSAKDTIEIGVRGVSKASALEALRVSVGVATAHTVAVGDNLNDIEMIKWAGRGIAMGQAPAIVRRAACEVTLPCDDDGLAIVLESIIGKLRRTGVASVFNPIGPTGS